MVLNTFVPAPPQNNVVILQIQGGLPPFLVNWNGPNTNFNITTNNATIALPTNGSGGYTLKVKGSNGCTVTKRIQFNTCPTPFVVSVLDKTPSCPGQSNGTAKVEAIVPSNSMSTPIFSFSWPSGVAITQGNTSKVSGIQNGTHCVTVTESTCGQSLEQCFNLNYNSTFNILSILNTSYGCGTLPTGSISLGVSGGKPPYSFVWNNGSTSNPLTGLQSGDYAVTITDACGSTTTGSYTIGAESVFTVTPQVFKECTDQANGKIILSVSGDAPPYNYQWNNGQTTSSIYNLAAGFYTVTITDACGKVLVKNYTVGEYSPGTITMESVEPDCGQPGGQGELYVSVSNPYPITQYEWSNGAATQNIVGLVEGAYSVTATDSYGCTMTGTFTVPEDNFSVDVNGTHITNPGCASSTNGAIDLGIVLSQYQPQSYSYIWSNGATTQDLTGIGAGTYTVTMTDAKGCIVNQSFELQATNASPEIILIELDFPTMPLSGIPLNDGGIDISIASGNMVNILWSNGSTNPDINGVGPGMYTVTVTNIVNGCSATASYMLAPQTPIPNLSVLLDPFNGGITPCISTSNGYNVQDGEIDITVSGGCTPYSFSWSGPVGFPGATTEDLEGLTIPGQYCVTVTDVCGSTAVVKCAELVCNCDMWAQIDVENPCLENGLFDDGSADLEFYNAPPGTYDIKFIQTSPDTEVKGTGRIVSYGNYDWDLISGKAKVEVGEGNYLVIITDQNGCSVSFTYLFRHENCNVVEQDIWLPGWYADDNLPPVHAIGICAAAGTCGSVTSSYEGVTWPFMGDGTPDDWGVFRFYTCATMGENICNAAGIIKCPHDCGPSDWHEVKANSGGQLINLGDDGCGCLFPPGAIPDFENFPDPVFAEIDCEDPAPPNDEILPCGTTPTFPPPPKFTCPCEAGCYQIYDEESCSYSVYCNGNEEPVEGQEDIPNYSLCRSNLSFHDINQQTIIASFYLQCNTVPCNVDWVGAFIFSANENPLTYLSGENYTNELLDNITLLSEIPNINLEDLGLDCVNEAPDFCNLVTDIDVCVCPDYQFQDGGIGVEERSISSNPLSMNGNIEKDLIKPNFELFQSKVSPNPFSSSINLDLNLAIGGEIIVQVFDYSGKLVEMNKLRVSKGPSQINYSVDNANLDGLYFIKLVNEHGETHVHKVVKSSSQH